MAGKVSFISEDTKFILKKKSAFRNWIKLLVANHGGKLNEITYIFCSDEYLYNLNQSYLSHDTLTDIITFPYDSFPIITSDIFISVDRVRENAEDRMIDFENELARVMAHGILHLCGFGDKSDNEKEKMRSKEEEALALFSFN